MEITRDDGGFSLRGDLTVDNAAAAYRSTPDFPAGDCRLDLAGIENTDSAGLALLVYWIRQAEAAGCRLIPENAPAQMRSLLRVAGLGMLIGDVEGEATDAGEPLAGVGSGDL